MTDIGADEGFLDPEDYVRIQILVATCKDMRNELSTVRRYYHEMHMLRPPRVTTLRLQNIAYGSICRDRVGCRSAGPEMDCVLIGGKEAATGRYSTRLVKLFDVIEDSCIRKSHIDRGACVGDSKDRKEKSI